MAEPQNDGWDIVSTGAPTSSQTAAPQQQPSGDDGWNVAQQHDGSDSGIGETIANITTGLGRGIMKGGFDTVQGTSQILNKIPLVGETLAPSEGLKAQEKMGLADVPGVGNVLDPTGETHNKGMAAANTSETVGKVGENVLEFLMGDAALKGLTSAQKLKKVASILEIAETHPRVMQALTALASDSKAVRATTGALDAAKAIVADAAKSGLQQGIVGGAQELVKSGGDIGKAAETGLESGVIGGALEVPIMAGGKALRAARNSRKVIEELSAKSANAVEPKALSEAVQKHVQDFKGSLGSDFETGVKNAMADMPDQTVQIAGSPLQKASQAILDSAEGKGGSQFLAGLKEDGGTLLPDFDKIKPRLERLANPGEVVDEATGQVKKEALPDMNVDDLIQTRQMFAEEARAFPDNHPIARNLRKLNRSIDDTIGQLADQSGNPDIAQNYKNVRAKYARGLALLDKPIVKAALKGEFDDVASKMMGTQKSIDNVRALKEVLGPSKMNDLSEAIFGNWVKDATNPKTGVFDPAKLLEQWNDVPNDMKKELFNLDALKNTDSPAFQQWFEGSKITDDAGKPMKVFHGTQAPENFDTFRTPDAGENQSLSGADPGAYLGVHFTPNPEVANTFAMRDKGWLKTSGASVPSGDLKPRVIPSYLNLKNPLNFGNEYNMRKFLYEGDLTKAGYAGDDALEQAMEANGVDPFDDEMAQKWHDMYQNDPAFRRQINEHMFEGLLKVDIPEDAQHELAQELGMQARDRLTEMGHDGVAYNNEVEGGKAYVAFNPEEQVSNAISGKVLQDAKEGFTKVMQNAEAAAQVQHIIRKTMATGMAAGAAGGLGGLHASGHGFLGLGLEVFLGSMVRRTGIEGVSQLLDHISKSPKTLKNIEAFGEMLQKQGTQDVKTSATSLATQGVDKVKESWGSKFGAIPAQNQEK